MFIITEDDTDKTETALYASQYEWIKTHYGEQAAENANYGWAVISNGESPFLEVATKVYGHGLLMSDALNIIEDGGELQVTHQFEAS